VGNTLTVKQIQWGKFSGREQVPVVQFSYCYMYINWLIHTTGITSGVGTPETFLTEHLIHSFGIFKLFFESESSKNKTTTIKKKKKYYERVMQLHLDHSIFKLPMMQKLFSHKTKFLFFYMNKFVIFLHSSTVTKLSCWKAQSDY
jgi:hypothetical protein